MGLDARTNKTIANVSSDAKDSIGKLTATAETVIGPLSIGVEKISGGIENILVSVADRIKLTKREHNELMTKIIALAQENFRLEQRHINVDSVTAQIKLSLIETSQAYTSFTNKKISIENSGIFDQQIEVEYMGAWRVNYKLRIGVDIDKLRMV